MSFKCSIIIYQYTNLGTYNNLNALYFPYLICTQSVLHLLVECLKVVFFFFF